MEGKPYKTGLVLGGGGTRGFTHLGVVKALHEKGIVPDVISGVSAGSIAGCLLADGHKPDAILKFLSERSFRSYIPLRFSKFGLFSMKGLQQKLNQILSVRRIEDLSTPLYIAVTNLNSGNIEYKHEGPVIDLVMASSSIPLLFKPMKIDGKLYVDGGLIDNLPISPIIDLCERLIIVNLIPIQENTEFTKRKSLFKKIADIAVYHHIKSDIREPDILIEPYELVHHSYFSTKRAQAMFDLGYRYTLGRVQI
jgi:NTE family protein